MLKAVKELNEKIFKLHLEYSRKGLKVKNLYIGQEEMATIILEGFEFLNWGNDGQTYLGLKIHRLDQDSYLDISA